MILLFYFDFFFLDITRLELNLMAGFLALASLPWTGSVIKIPFLSSQSKIRSSIREKCSSFENSLLLIGFCIISNRISEAIYVKFGVFY